MKTVILLASDGYGVGKSTTAHNYSKTKNNSCVYTIASPVRDYCNDLFKYLFPSINKTFTSFYTTENKNKLMREYLPILQSDNLYNSTFRDFINSASDNLQSTYTDKIWGNYAANFIQQSNSDIIIIDDFRGETEYYCMLNKLKNKVNFITVYLIKPDVKNNKNSNWEGRLNNFNFDIFFNIEPDYSNIQDLYLKLNERILYE